MGTDPQRRAAVEVLSVLQRYQPRWDKSQNVHLLTGNLQKPSVSGLRDLSNTQTFGWLSVPPQALH